jgi:hypothetical protein
MHDGHFRAIILALLTRPIVLHSAILSFIYVQKKERLNFCVQKLCCMGKLRPYMRRIAGVHTHVFVNTIHV